MIDLVGYVRFDKTVKLNRVVNEISTFLLNDLGAATRISDMHDSSLDNDGSFIMQIIGDADHKVVKDELQKFENKAPYMLSITYDS